MWATKKKAPAQRTSAKEVITFTQTDDIFNLIILNEKGNKKITFALYQQLQKDVPAILCLLESLFSTHFLILLLLCLKLL